jgi:hypothetical protein
MVNRIKMLAIGLGLIVGLPLFGYHHNYNHYQHHQERNYPEGHNGNHHLPDHSFHKIRGDSNNNLNPEEICDRYYECLDGCPTVMYVKCQENCHKKYPCDDF